MGLGQFFVSTAGRRILDAVSGTSGRDTAHGTQHMAHVARSDTLGAAWLLQHARAQRGLAALPDDVATAYAVRRMVSEDSERFGARCTVRPTRHTLDALAGHSGASASLLDLDLAEQVKLALDGQLDGLATCVANDLTTRETADRLGVSQSRVARALRAVKESFNRADSE